MTHNQPPFVLAERVADVARALGMETALIGAAALAVYGYVRATVDVDLAVSTINFTDLRELEEALRAIGMHTTSSMPDDEDPLGGVVRVWSSFENDVPIDKVEVVNFYNPLSPRRNPGTEAIRNATAFDPRTALRCVRIADLIALKLYDGSRQGQGDIVALLRLNPDADLAEIRAVAQKYGYGEIIEELIAESRGA